MEFDARILFLFDKILWKYVQNLLADSVIKDESDRN